MKTQLLICSAGRWGQVKLNPKIHNFLLTFMIERHQHCSTSQLDMPTLPSISIRKITQICLTFCSAEGLWGVYWNKRCTITTEEEPVLSQSHTIWYLRESALISEISVQHRKGKSVTKETVLDKSELLKLLYHNVFLSLFCFVTAAPCGGACCDVYRLFPPVY